MSMRFLRLLATAIPVMTAAVLATSMAAPAAETAHHLAAAPVSHQSAIPPNVDVSEMLGNHADDTIAANPLDPLNVVAVSLASTLPQGLFEGVTFNGGRTWSRRVIGSGPPLGEICCDEQVAWDRYGNLWLSYLLNTHTLGNVGIAVSTNGGLTFTKVTEIVPTGPKRGTKQFADQPHLAVGPNSVWVSWNSSSAANQRGYVQAAGARVTGLGRFGPFSKPETVPTANGQGDYGDTAVGPDGQVMVIYESNILTRCCSRIYAAVDPDGLGPKGFGRPVLVGRSNVGGIYTIPAAPGQGIDANPKAGWDFGGGKFRGRVYAVWTQATPRNSDNLNTELTYSDNDGRTWAKAVRLDDHQTVNSEFYPAIAVDQATGDVAVGWYDCRNRLGNQGPGCQPPDYYTQFWATYSTNGGVTWVPDFQVSKGTSDARDDHDSFDFGDYTHVAFQSHLFYPAWSDNSNSTGTNPNGTLNMLDLYMARIVVP